MQPITQQTAPQKSKNVLIISGHPDLATSVANVTILDEVANALLNAQIRYLDKLYSNYQIDVQAEQEALLKADVIVWQFPFSWYSVPGLMKLWIDQVLVYGFAHGSNAKLGGKKLLISFTTGAPDAVYQKDGFFGYTMEEFLPQFEVTAKLCGLDYQPPIFTQGIGYTDRDNMDKINAQKEKAKLHAQQLIATINALTA